jgi:CRP/FNR family transcriptional regulator, cyclic AMP receptor protein
VIAAGEAMTGISTTWIDILGYAASLSVLATFCMSTMVPLRIVAISSNVLFASFGAFAHIYPVLVLHLVLLPVNIMRLVQLLRLIRGIKAAQASDLSIDALIPFMSYRRFAAGHVLMNKGEKAEGMYYLAKGRMHIPEFGKFLEPGAVIGEIGIFARSQKRTATVVCVSDCDIYEMSESKAKQLYYQDRSFGLAVLQLIIARFMENMDVTKTASPEASNSAPASEAAA